MANLLKGETEDEWAKSISYVVAVHGKDAVEAWKEETVHRHRLIHVVAVRNYDQVLREMVEEHGFDMNIPRDSDQCTPMHLAWFYNNSDVVKALHMLGADLTLKNRYGETFDGRHEMFDASCQNIMWLDLELTHGHYAGILGGAHSGETPHILEAAAVVTNKDLEELGRGHWVIGGFTKQYLEGLDRFHQLHFRDGRPGGEFPPLGGSPGNGLFSDVLASHTTLGMAEEAMVGLLAEHCPGRGCRCPLAGTSVQCDREVLKARMPRLYSMVSHEILDGSTILGLVRRWLPEKIPEWQANNRTRGLYNHRALNDINWSIQSMRWARAHLFVQPREKPAVLATA